MGEACSGQLLVVEAVVRFWLGHAGKLGKSLLRASFMEVFGVVGLCSQKPCSL